MAAGPPTVGGNGAQIAGEDYTLTCQVTGGGTTSPTYQWFKGGTPLTGQTSATLSFSPLSQAAHNGSYSCEATQDGLRSAAVNITVAGMG